MPQQKISVVTGGSGGMGKACARLLAKQGPVIIADLRSANLRPPRPNCAAAGGEVTTAVCDVSSAAFRGRVGAKGRCGWTGAGFGAYRGLVADDGGLAPDHERQPGGVGADRTGLSALDGAGRGRRVHRLDGRPYRAAQRELYSQCSKIRCGRTFRAGWKR